MNTGFLTASQRQRLRAQLRQARSVRLYRRTLALLEVDAGIAVTQVADALAVSRQSIHNWLEAFRRDPTPETLADQPRPGRPSVWTAALRDWLRLALTHRPEYWGYPAMNWTVPLLQDFLASRGGVSISEASLRRELHAHQRVWKRFRYVLPPDPEREKKTAAPAATPAPAATERGPGRGRDRPAVVPAVTQRLGGAGATGTGPDQRLQRQTGAVWGLEHPDGAAAVPAPPEAPWRGLPNLPGAGALALAKF
jgi:transposase